MDTDRREIEKLYARVRRSEKRKKRILLFLCMIPLAAILMAGAWCIRHRDDGKIEVTYYQIRSDIRNGPVRCVLMSDLHNREFGKDNEELVQVVEKLEPDLILLAGDMADGKEKDISVVLKLCEDLLLISPVYYGLGNNEGELMYGDGEDIRLMQALFEMGIPVLFNSWETVDVRGNRIMVGGGISSQERFRGEDAAFIEQFEKSEGVRILINHDPTALYEHLYDADIDLAVAGHFHGGQIRIPGLGGLYHIDAGFFPRYCEGMFDLEKGKLVVTRGLGSGGVVPRINDPPEVAVIDIKREEEKTVK